MAKGWFAPAAPSSGGRAESYLPLILSFSLPPSRAVSVSPLDRQMSGNCLLLTLSLPVFLKCSFIYDVLSLRTCRHFKAVFQNKAISDELCLRYKVINSLFLLLYF